MESIPGYDARKTTPPDDDPHRDLPPIAGEDELTELCDGAAFFRCCRGWASRTLSIVRGDGVRLLVCAEGFRRHIEDLARPLTEDEAATLAMLNAEELQGPDFEPNDRQLAAYGGGRSIDEDLSEAARIQRDLK